MGLPHAPCYIHRGGWCRWMAISEYHYQKLGLEIGGLRPDGDSNKLIRRYPFIIKLVKLVAMVLTSLAADEDE